MQALAFYKSAPAHLTKNQEAGRAELARSLSIQYLHSIYIIFTQYLHSSFYYIYSRTAPTTLPSIPKSNPLYPVMSEGVTFKYEEARGRYSTGQ